MQVSVFCALYLLFTFNFYTEKARDNMILGTDEKRRRQNHFASS